MNRLHERSWAALGPFPCSAVPLQPKLLRVVPAAAVPQNGEQGHRGEEMEAKPRPRPAWQRPWQPLPEEAVPKALCAQPRDSGSIQACLDPWGSHTLPGPCGGLCSGRESSCSSVDSSAVTAHIRRRTWQPTSELCLCKAMC